MSRGAGRDALCFHGLYWADVPRGIAGFKVDVVQPLLAWVEARQACIGSCVLDGCLGLEVSYAIECKYHGGNTLYVGSWLAARVTLSRSNFLVVIECELYDTATGGIDTTTWKAFRLLDTKAFKMVEPIWPSALNSAMVVKAAGTGDPKLSVWLAMARRNRITIDYVSLDCWLWWCLDQDKAAL